MASDEGDARLLLEVAPDQYVTERGRLVKEAKANRDKTRAAFYQALKRPGVGLWAVLAAGSDVDDVHKVIAATEELGGVQAKGSNAASLTEATQQRRKVLETFVGKAVKALKQWDAGAEKRRPEIRSLVDQLSRHPELADTWINGTLRELPDDEFGFGAFADVDVSAPAKAPAKSPTPAKTKAKTGGRVAAEPKEPERDLGAERRARAERLEQARQAKKAVVDAARHVTAAERRVGVARAAVRDAEKQLRLAEAEQDKAERRHQEAVAHHESLR